MIVPIHQTHVSSIINCLGFIQYFPIIHHCYLYLAASNASRLNLYTDLNFCVTDLFNPQNVTRGGESGASVTEFYVKHALREIGTLYRSN